jgi:hypothetical protein
MAWQDTRPEKPRSADFCGTFLVSVALRLKLRADAFEKNSPLAGF